MSSWLNNTRRYSNSALRAPLTAPDSARLFRNADASEVDAEMVDRLGTLDSTSCDPSGPPYTLLNVPAVSVFPASWKEFVIIQTHSSRKFIFHWQNFRGGPPRGNRPRTSNPCPSNPCRNGLWPIRTYLCPINPCTVRPCSYLPYPSLQYPSIP